ncbi:P-loop NTPase fold protein [Rheinheimera sp. 1928-s]|uniref:P-loop NTPase fold protein n=1 Tax=Rheinheimera sp. 1928-s TaxID=3033803 RepID=UPI0026248EAD|nr:P-loop NTPase fold protein [Rheinheimera sp. 1928-s]MDF3125063.1 P-loop NTPase fold protein [Rheinheimera sp. 1928-s]
MSDKSSDYDYSFKVLHERIADVDLFEDQTHESLANTLVRLIKTSDKGMTIGLEGAWGSGKSTVIHLLASKLHSDVDAKTLFFSFDAWAHDGDPLRKIFLESLLEKIDPEGKDDSLTELKSKVSARSKKVEVVTSKGVSVLGKLISISAFLVPLGAALLSALNYEKIFAPWHKSADSVSWPFLFGMMFVLMPLLVMFFWWLASLVNPKLTWDFLESDSTETYTQDITEDGERTSIEFERFFSEIMEKILTKECKYDRCIIVIDNLDRVEPDFAQSIWSTLQTFFQHRSTTSIRDNSNWRDRLWFVVPFDREGLCKVWSAQSSNLEQTQLSHLDNYEQSEYKSMQRFQYSTDEVAKSFFEKCFQVIADVPSPVMSAWINYFNQAVETSLNGWPHERIEEFKATYIRCMSKLDSSPTPREMHSTINKVGIITLEFKDLFSAEAVCIFALLKLTENEAYIRKSLLRQGIPKEIPTIRPVEEIRSHLAGLLFKVSPEKGIQLLIAPEIRNSLQKGDGETLSLLFKAHKQAFWVGWVASRTEWMITDRHTDEYRINATNAIYHAFKSDKNLIKGDIDNLKSVWVKTFENWRFEDYSFLQPITQIIELTNQEEGILSWLGQEMKAKIKEIVNKVESEDFPESQLPYIAELDNFLHNKGNFLPQLLYPKLNASNWQRWIQYQEQYIDTRFLTVLPAKGALESIIRSGFNSPTIDKKLLNTIRISCELYSSCREWETTIDVMLSWANLPNRESECEDFYSLLIHLLANSTDNVRKKIKECLNAGDFWVRSNLSPIKTNPSLPVLAALCIENMQESLLVGVEVKTFWKEENGSVNCEDVVVLFEKSKSLSHIWNMASDKEYLLALNIICNSDNDSLFSQRRGIYHLDNLDALNKSELSRIVNKLCENGALSAYEDGLKSSPKPFAYVMYLLLNHGGGKADSIINNVISSLSEDDWLVALKENSYLHDCIRRKHINFSKAFKSHLVEIIQNYENKDFEWIWDDFDRLVSKTMDFNRTILPTLCDTYFSTNEDLLSQKGFEKLSGIVEKNISRQPQIAIEKRVISWLENSQNERIRWLLTANLKIKEPPLELLVSLVVQYKLEHPENSELYDDIGDRFGFYDKLLVTEESKSEDSTTEGMLG